MIICSTKEFDSRIKDYLMTMLQWEDEDTIDIWQYDTTEYGIKVNYKYKPFNSDTWRDRNYIILNSDILIMNSFIENVRFTNPNNI